MKETTQAIPSTISQIEDAHKQLINRVLKTPCIPWDNATKNRLLGPDAQVNVKLELFQKGGSFKLRGALTVMDSLSPDVLKRGVTAVSAGNHAIAVGLAAQQMETSAKVVMPKSANPSRVAMCKSLGTEVILVDNVAKAFEEVRRIQDEEKRTFVHPFEGPLTALGTGTAGYEWLQQVPDLEAVILPIGGGGLAAGMASAIGQINPNCQLFGVEPEGADSMSRSFRSGKTESIEAVKTIADSLGAPFSMPYSFSLCQQFLEKVVLVDDDQIRSTMRLMFDELKLAPEPAAAASLAALLGPLRDELKGKKVGVIACGANIDPDSFYGYIKDATPW